MSKNKAYALSFFILSLALSLGLFVFRDNFKNFQSLGLIGIFLINLISSATFFISGPAFLTVIAGGSIYNPFLVAIVASLGASIGDMVSYFVGFSGRHIALEKLKKKFWLNILEDVFKTWGVFFVFVLALIPNPFFDAIGLIAGVLGMNYKKFFIVMLVGRFARFILLALLGFGIR